MREEFAVLDHQLNAGAVHVNDAPRANVKMTNFAVAHLPIGQADGWAAGLDQRVGILPQQTVVHRLAGKCDRIGFGLGAVTPAIEDDQDEWFGTRHIKNLIMGMRSADSAYNSL